MSNPSATVQVGLVQMACGTSKTDNLDKAERMVREAAGKGAQIVCLQELFATQYFCQSEDHRHFALAEPVDGPTVGRFAAVARECGVVVVVSFFERRAAGLYHNSAAVIDAGGDVLGVYRKMHIPDDPLYYEKFYFAPGDLGYRAWDTAHGRIGVCICWDQWYPEAARATALRGADILFYPTAIGWHPSEKEASGDTQYSAWETMQRSHAIANGCFVVAVNRVGHEAPAGGEGIEFWGRSFIAAPSGKTLARAGVGTEETLVCGLDLGDVEAHRTHWPFLRDRRIDSYDDLAERFIG